MKAFIHTEEMTRGVKRTRQIANIFTLVWLCNNLLGKVICQFKGRK